MKKTNNKGFSLVELIVVIAIMGVLMVVLAPQYLRYVEKTRLQKDNSLISEIAEVIRVSCADDVIASKLPTTAFTIKSTNSANNPLTFDFSDYSSLNGTHSNGEELLIDELKVAVGDPSTFKVTTGSNTYKDAASIITFTVEYQSSTGGYSIEADGIIQSPGSTTTTSIQY